MCLYICARCAEGKGVKYGPKVGQIDPNLDKSGSFLDEISENCAKSDLEKPRGLVVLFWDQSVALWGQNLTSPSMRDDLVCSRDGRFGSKVGQIGPQIGQIRDFFRSDFSTFGSSSQMY